MVKMLAEMGIDPAKEDTLKQTALFYASREGNSNVISFLLTEGRDNVNRQDKYG